MEVGAAVKIVALQQRDDLNGKTGTVLCVDAERAGVAIEGIANPVRIRFVNLQLDATPANHEPPGETVRSSASSSRSDAARDLCRFLAAENQDAGFLLHPALQFDETNGDVSVRATSRLERGDVLLVVPEDATISAAAPWCRSLPVGDCMMGDVLEAVEAGFEDAFPHGLEVLEAHNCTLAVLMMRVSLRPSSALHERMAATWPSLTALQGAMPLTYSATALEGLHGTTVSDALRAVRSDATLAFDAVVGPQLRAAGLAEHFTAGGHGLFEAWLHALTLCLSRTHEDNSSALRSSDVGKLTAVADLFNGVPEGHPAVNIELKRGAWGALTRGAVVGAVGAGAGRASADAGTHSALLCTSVRLTRAVGAGEELVYSYGDFPTTAFVLKFGCVPLPLEWPNLNDELSLSLPPTLVPAADDGQRRAALRVLGYSAEDLHVHSCFFVADSELQADAEAHLDETGERLLGYDDADAEGGLAKLRLFALVLLAAPPVLSRVIEGGHGGGAPSALEMALEELALPEPSAIEAVLGQIVAFNLERLPRPRVDEGDLGGAELVVARAQFKQRAQLEKWRAHFLTMQYADLSHPPPRSSSSCPPPP